MDAFLKKRNDVGGRGRFWAMKSGFANTVDVPKS